MTDSSYHIAWLIYTLACAGLCMSGWHLIKSRIPWPPHSILIPLLILLLTPYFSDPAQSRLAPAILIVLFEAVFGNTEIAIKAIIPVAGLFLISIIAILLFRFKISLQKPSC